MLFDSFFIDESRGTLSATRRTSLQTSVLNRRIDLYGFTPRLAYIFTHNSSTITLFDYDRSRFEIGMTRQF